MIDSAANELRGEIMKHILKGVTIIILVVLGAIIIDAVLDPGPAFYFACGIWGLLITGVLFR